MTSVLGLRWGFVFFLVCAAVAAGWLMPRHPVVAIVILSVLLAVGLVQWRVGVAERRVLDAGLRCDLDALECLARDSGPVVRFRAAATLLHHGGFVRRPISLCSCGQCENDALSAELDATREIVRLAWRGDGPEAFRLALGDAVDAEALPPLRRELFTGVRVMNTLVAYAARSAHEALDATERELFASSLQFVEAHWTALRWPARLAAAREAAARGDHARARELLGGMPAWPAGSPLAVVYAELAERVHSFPPA